MRINLLILVCLLPVFAFTQIKIDTIKSDDRPDELYFPLVRHSKPAVAQKINDYLQSNLLQNTTKKTSPGKLFERTKHIMNDSVSRGGISFTDFTPLLNNGKIFSIQIDVEYMAAHASSSSNYFNFNAQNGEIILVEDLFTNSGLQSLKKTITAERKKRINSRLVEIKNNKLEEFYDDLDYITQTFEECLTYDTLDRFCIKSSSLIFYKSNCFPHALGPYEIDLKVGLSLEKLSPWLSEFGKRALLMKSVSIEKELISGIAKPFRGSIDAKYPIVLQLSEMGTILSGFYYYESQGINISLSCSLNGNSIFMEETDDEGNTTGTFKGTYDGKQISGTWTSSKTGKALPFSVKN